MTFHTGPNSESTAGASDELSFSSARLCGSMTPNADSAAFPLLKLQHVATRVKGFQKQIEEWSIGVKILRTSVFSDKY